MPTLRSYQRTLLNDCQAAWADGSKVVMPVLPTGGGKTVVIGQAIAEHDGDGFAMAHRAELVGQISVALGRSEIKHTIVASDAVRRSIQMAHHEEFGRSWIDPRADWHVGSVDTVIRRQIPKLRKPLIVQDEGHHVLKANKWGKAFAMFPEGSLGMFPTATPIRGDGKGLGAEYDGLVDVMVEGPGMRDLINMGMLTDYDVLAPTAQDLDLTDVKVTASGELNMQEAAKRIAASSRIVGNVIDHYLAHASGRLGVTFAVDISEARKITEAFNKAGVPAALVTGEDSEEIRRGILARFRRRELLMLVNVDLFGEGFDLPAIEVVIMARPTASFSLYAQQWGRALRLMVDPMHIRMWDTYDIPTRLWLIANSAKPKALIIDHVGNLLRHQGPPDKPRPWSLAPRSRQRGVSDEIPLTACTVCSKPYERIYPSCPWCGAVPELSASAGGMGPEAVDGDLVLLTAEELARMRGEVVNVHAAPHVPRHIQGTPAGTAAVRNINERNRAQQNLRHVMDCWAGMWSKEDRRVRERRFFHTFKIDVLSAQSLGRPEADALRAKIATKIELAGFTIPALPFPVNYGD